MKCPNCGAEIGNNSKFCEYCGSQVSVEMRKEQEQLNKAGCPKCGSTNIVFEREKQGEFRGKTGTSVIRATVGVCKDCGYTWHTSDSSGQPGKNNTVWWVLGWLFFFPAPVMVLIWRKKNKWDIKIKIAVTVVFWVLLFIIGSGNNSGSKAAATATSVPKTVSTASVKTEKPAATDAPKSVEKAQAAEEPESSEEAQAAEEPETDSVSKEFKNALKQAEWYASILNMSKQGVYDQLTSPYGEGFPADAAQYAVDNLQCDWNENALQSAISYSNTMHMSKQGIYDQLISEYGEKFTKSEAQYAVDHIQADWNENALETARVYQDTMGMSKSAIYDQLTSKYGEKFTKSEAQYAIDHLD